MSVSESSSEDYYQIIDSFLNTQNYKEWDQMPEITYMTFKAILNQIFSMEEKIAKNTELTTALSLKIRETNFVVQEIAHQNIQKELSAPSRKESGFKKKKSVKATKNNNQISVNQFHRSVPKIPGDKNKSLFDSCYGDTKRGLFEGSFRQHDNNIAEGLNETMIQQVKAMAEAILEQSNFVKSEQLIQLQSKLKKNSQKIQLKLNKQFSSVSEFIRGKIELLQKNLIDIEMKFSKKVREDQSWLFNFIQQNCLMKNQLKNVLNQEVNFHNTISYLQKEQYVLDDGETKEKKDKTNKTAMISKKNSIRKNGSCESLKRQKTLSNKTKHKKQPTLITEANEDFREFRVRILKDICDRMKTVDVQKLFDTMQKQMGDRHKKLNHKIISLQKKIEQGIQQRKKLSQSPKRTNASRKYSQIGNRETINKQRLKEQQEELPSKNQKEEKKNEYKKMVRSLQKSIASLESSLSQKIQKTAESWRNQLNSSLNRKEKQIMKDFEEREKLLCQVLEENVKSIQSNFKNPESENSVEKINRALNKIAQQMIVARYLYFGEHECNDLIHWEKQAINTMSENYMWINGKPNVTVKASGLYKIQAGIYNAFQTLKYQTLEEGGQEISPVKNEFAYLMLNGQPISSFSMIKDLPELGNAKVSQAGLKARGNLFCEPILLPAKSQISVKLASKFYGQAYLQIQQL